MTPRQERKARAYAAVEALLNRENDAWAKFQRLKRETAMRKLLPTRIAKARARLAQLEAEYADLMGHQP